jgi:hypothetical protein
LYSHAGSSSLFDPHQQARRPPMTQCHNDVDCRARQEAWDMITKTYTWRVLLKVKK